MVFRGEHLPVEIISDDRLDTFVPIKGRSIYVTAEGSILSTLNPAIPSFPLTPATKVLIRMDGVVGLFNDIAAPAIYLNSTTLITNYSVTIGATGTVFADRGSNKAVVFLGYNARFTNHGDTQGGVSITGNLAANPADIATYPIHFDNSGTISARYGAVNLTGRNVEANNSGTITNHGLIASGPGGSAAIDISGGGSDTLRNFGTIDGLIALGFCNDTFRNTGLVTGSSAWATMTTFSTAVAARSRE